MILDNKQAKNDFSFLDQSKGEAIKKYGFGLIIDEMAKAGLQFGHRTSNCHPKMKPYFQGVRNGISLINLEKTAEKFEEALKYIENLISEGKILLLIGTKVQVKDLVKSTAQECKLFYVENRWLGGTFTNFEVIKKRLAFLKELEAKKESGELEKYTKKEQAKINKKIRDLETKFGGIKEMTKIPDAVFIVDIKKEHLALKEARDKGIKVIAVCDANSDPTLVDYPIPANDDAVSSIKYILDKAKTVILNKKIGSINPSKSA